MSLVKIRNGVIKEARIYVEDHGLLTSSIGIDYGGDYGGAFQSFGGYSFGGFRDKKLKGDYMGLWVRGIFRVTEKDDWNRLPGTPVRVETDTGVITKIGHFLKDEWFDPGEEYKAYEKIWSDMQKSG